MDVLSQHCWDQNPSNQRKSNNDSRNSSLNNRSSGNHHRINRNCDQNHSCSNHNNSNETRTNSSNPSAPTFAQQGQHNSGGQSQLHSQAICHACGKMGHIHRDCDKDIPRECWFINRAFQAVQDISQDAAPAHISRSSNNALTGTRRSQCSSTPAQIAGVTTTMTLAGKAYSSLTFLTNLTRF